MRVGSQGSRLKLTTILATGGKFLQILTSSSSKRLSHPNIEQLLDEVEQNIVICQLRADQLNQIQNQNQVKPKLTEGCKQSE